MDQDDRILGLAPALTLEKQMHWGPLRLQPIHEVENQRLALIAERYAKERGAHATGQAFVTCRAGVEPLVPTIWSLFVFSCVSFARASPEGFRTVPFPENFHLLPITSRSSGFVLVSGQSTAVGEARHIPLCWPVDAPQVLRERCWDRRIELACALIAKNPAKAMQNGTVIAAGMAADLACTAMETRSQNVESWAPAARTFILLASAFESLHSRGSPVRHTHSQVSERVSRLDVGTTHLGAPVFSSPRRDPTKPPAPMPGSIETRAVFATRHLFYLRNVFAHGRVPAQNEFTLPAELNNADVLRATTLILAGLVGGDLMEELGCPRLSQTNLVVEHAARLGLPPEALLAALWDGERLLETLEETLVPK